MLLFNSIQITGPAQQLKERNRTMLDMNKVLLAGNLVRDPESRTIGEGVSVCELRLAVNRQFKDRQGNERDEVCYVDVDAFRGCAENCQKYLHKASPVLIEGRLKMEQWDDRETGKKVTRMKVVAELVHFLGTGESRRNGGTPAANNGSRQVNGSDAGYPASSGQTARQGRQNAPQRAA
jgi:single-strand DNA-binding protein